MYDVLVAGEINPDLILSAPDLKVEFGQVETLVEDSTLTIGSSSAIFACGAARLGLRVAFIGMVGDDLFGRFMLQALHDRSVNTTNVCVNPSLKTGFSVILNRGDDRAILTYSGAMSELQAEQIPNDLLLQARHLHIASYFLQTRLQPGLPDLLSRARACGLTTSLDPNWDPSERWAGFEKLLPFIDVFFPNEAEAISLAHAQTCEEALDKLGKHCKLVAIKLGARGAIARGGDCMVKASSPTVRVVDTVGAGDSFDAGFIYGYLQGWEIERCLHLATTCGALSIRNHGGTVGQPTLAEAQAVGVDNGR
ncbi:MAG: putative carbohydrate kinase [Chloroflexi bacterium]|jgi:sugar/nucleoside kinase (ribokinase family)|nr:putative carbohydrate kinase [Chloroflexota bacterium]